MDVEFWDDDLDEDWEFTIPSDPDDVDPGSQPRLLEVLRDGPFRTPDWRWRQVVALQRFPIEPLHEYADEVIQEALGIVGLPLRDDGRAVDTASPFEQALETARHVYDEDGPLRWELEARILTGQTDDEIASCCRLQPDAIEVFESLFFNLRDRLKAGDYIRCLIGSTQTLSGLWRHVAFSGGAPLLDLVLWVTLDREPPQWFQELPSDDPAADAADMRRRINVVIDSIRLEYQTLTVAQHLGLLEAVREHRQASRERLAAEATPASYLDGRERPRSWLVRWEA